MTTKINYGIYIDRKHAFVIALNHLQHEQFISEIELENPGGIARTTHVTRQENVQNRAAENLSKLCKSVIALLKDANSIFIFGPSRSKYTLRNTIHETARLKSVIAQVVAADVMDSNAAVKFTKDHFSTITAGHQVFTASKIQ